jgi:quercetin dioxygenase-like cupin family protein
MNFCATMLLDMERNTDQTDNERVSEHKMEIPEVMKLKDLVAYQDRAVVSKTIVEKHAGTVTAFAFDDSQGLSEHTAPYDALVIIIEGKAQIRISGNEFRFEEGETIMLPANKPHSLKAVTKVKMLLVMILAKS